MASFKDHFAAFLSATGFVFDSDEIQDIKFGSNPVDLASILSGRTKTDLIPLTICLKSKKE